jgi:hypothetical protein
VMLRSASHINLLAASSVGKWPRVPYGLAHLPVHALDRVGGVDHPRDLGREGKERDDVRPRPPPRGSDGGELAAPCARLERVQRCRGDLRACRSVDRAQRLGERLAVLC